MDEKIAHDALQENHHTEAIKNDYAKQIILSSTIAWLGTLCSIN